MLDIRGHCRFCKSDYYVQVDDTKCFSCFLKLHRETLKPKRSLLKFVKNLSWWAVFMMPISYFIGVYFGFGYQMAFNVGFVASPIIAHIANTLNDKF